MPIISTPVGPGDTHNLVELQVPFSRPSQLSGEMMTEAVNGVLQALSVDGTLARLEALVGSEWLARQDSRALLRAALTVRPAGKWKQETLQQLDCLLATEATLGPHTNPQSLPRIAGLPVALWQGDITHLASDAIVNAANSELLGCFRPFHPCIDNAIHSAAGPRLREDCALLRSHRGQPEPTGVAATTRAYNLPSKFVIHTVGPIVQGELFGHHIDALRRCYLACLSVAGSLPAIRSLAFCGVSTGVFGFPREPAARIAVKTVLQWLSSHPNQLDMVVFNVYGEADKRAYESVFRTRGLVP